MEGFNFKLQKVLDFKVGVEEKKKEEFVAAQRSYFLQEKLVQELIDQKNIELNSSRKLRNSFEFQNHFRYISYLEEKIDEEKIILRNLEDVLNQRKQELIKSTSDRKSIEKLREKAREEFDFEINRREQKLNDDFAMFSFLRHERR